MSFNKWKDEYGLEFEPNYSKETESDCKAAFKAGQQSKQAEIDKLKMSNHYLSVQVTDAESYSEYWKHERDKLQKRIEVALNKSEDFYDFGDGESAMAFCNEIINILKGEQTK